MRRQDGFTLVELVIVIIILGILAATALPRFMDVTDEAHEGAVAAAGGGFTTAVALVHAQYIANGESGTVDNLSGFGNGDVDTNAAGWPTDTAGNNAVANGDDAVCVNIWNGIMQNPPSVSTAADAADYQADATANTCTYTYQPAAGLTITYTATNGNVVVDSSI